MVNRGQLTEHQRYLRKVKKDKRTIGITRFLILAIFIIVWEIAAELKWVDPFLVSSPSRVVEALVKYFYEGNLFRHIWITCYETIIGFVAGTIMGAVIAIILWWNKFIGKVLDPYLVVLNAIPKVALAPIIIFWVGNGITAIVVIALLISIIVTIISVYAGFMEVDGERIKLMETFGATKLQILKNLVLPSSIPLLMSALKINVGLSWVGVIMGEYLVAKEGLGFLIVYGGQIADLNSVMMAIIILSILAYIMYKVVAIFENKVIKKYR
ncbi:ABC transporter permease [uncultured Clostridium sp.]|uniref:ABC transporter permease n=1 Tax=Clostridium bornimense TaxID=1216932 RepID=UPI0025EB428C|nr:ABC transporter permease [uncultured Clostridium sp.]